MIRPGYSEAAKPQSPQSEGTAAELSDYELTDKAAGAANGDLFRRLWSGDLTGYASHSEADQALCNILAFWTGRDAGRMDRLYRQSGLMREKWDRKQSGTTYGAITIEKAVRDCKTVYDPRGDPARDFSQPAGAESTGDQQSKVIKAEGLLVSLEAIQEEEAEWLIPGRIPTKAITTIGADGGVGKTTVWADLAAGVSSGNKPLLAGDIPQCFWDLEPAKVLYFSSEDSSSVVLKPKLRKAGADFRNIATVDIKNIEAIKYNSPALAALFELFKPKLAIFDPVQGFLDARLDMAKRNAIRSAVIAPLAALAEKYGTAIILIAHSNKREGASDRGRLADSADLWDGSRSVMMIGQTNDGYRYISQEKSNYGPLSDTILFTIDSGGRANYFDTSKKHDRDFVNERADTKKNAPAREEARAQLIEALIDAGGTMPAEELNEFCKAASISGATLKRVKADLKREGRLKYVREGQPGKGQGVKTLVQWVEIPEESEETDGQAENEF